MTVLFPEVVIAPLCCPIHRQVLVVTEHGQLACRQCSEPFPLLHNIPILLADETERMCIAGSDFESVQFVGNRALDFYNQTRDHERYFRPELLGIRDDLARWLPEAKADGPILEIGSGKGALQGIDAGYVAFDYSYTALRNYVQDRYQRVCGSASALPFPDDTFRFLFTVATLEHVPEAGLAFDEIHRVLMPGGVAYICPAWHCVQYNCEGIPVRHYRDLTLRQKVIKLTLPLRQTLIAKAIGALPARVLRRAVWSLRKGPTRFRFKRLTPDYTHYWMSDTDATSRLDSHEACLFFHSRGYEILAPGPSARQQLLARHHAVVVRKP